MRGEKRWLVFGCYVGEVAVAVAVAVVVVGVGAGRIDKNHSRTSSLLQR